MFYIDRSQMSGFTNHHYKVMETAGGAGGLFRLPDATKITVSVIISILIDLRTPGQGGRRKRIPAPSSQYQRENYYPLCKQEIACVLKAVKPR